VTLRFRVWALVDELAGSSENKLIINNAADASLLVAHT